MLFGRRVTFAIIILVSQLLLIALAFTWLIQMSVIAKNGAVKFVEENPVILTAEIIMAALICLFALVVFVLQIIKLGERRRSDERRNR